MDQATYQHWWLLHVRAARGEKLDTEERAEYEAELKRLHQSEHIAPNLKDLQQAKAAVAVLESEQANLGARRRQLNAEIAALEAALAPQTRQVLTVEG